MDIEPIMKRGEILIACPQCGKMVDSLYMVREFFAGDAVGTIVQPPVCRECHEGRRMITTTYSEREPGQIITGHICDQDLQWHYGVRLMVMRSASFEEYRAYCMEVQALGSIVDTPGMFYYEVSVD